MATENDHEHPGRIALIEAGSPGLNIYSHVAMGRGIALLATVMRDAGYEALAYVEDISGKGSVDWDWVAEADVVGFSALTCTMPRTRELLRKAREVNPAAVIVFGGPEPTCEPRRSFEVGADYVLKGEAELTLPRFMAAVLGRSDEPLSEIPGVVWHEDDVLHDGPSKVQLTRAQLDALPLVDRSLIHHVERGSVAPVWRARGCPGRCDFCEVCEIWPRYVARDEGQTVEELVAAQDAGYHTAFLIDDNAAANKPAFKDLLRHASASGFARVLVTQIRADSVFGKDGRLDRELLKLLKKAASVTVVCVGVESADDADLEHVHKGIDSRRMAKALKAMRRYGLLVHGMFIALNEDTRETLRRNGEYARKYVTSLQYLFETPLPGTKRTRQHEARNALLFHETDDLRLYDGMHVVLKPEHMGAREMQDLVIRQYRRFYSARRVAVEALKGTFLRYRRLSDAQRAYLRRLDLRGRLTWWLRFHAEYKFAPVSFLAIGYRRVRELMRDADYASYESRLRAL